MNIGIITSSFPSHPEDHLQAPFIVDFIEGLMKRNHKVFVFTQDRIGLKKAFPEGVIVEWFSWMKTSKPLVQLNPLNPYHFLRILSLFRGGQRTITSFVTKHQIDVCLALWILPSGFFAHYAHRKTGIPYSIWALGSDVHRYGRNPLLRPILKKIVREARGVFADGFDLAKKIEELSGRRCEFLATTRRLGAIEREETGRRKDGPYRFLFVGRLEQVKGIDILLRAVKLLKAEGDLAFHLTIVGGGTMEEWVKTFSRKEKIEEEVTLAGIVSDAQLTEFYQSSDCVVIPSRSESIPLVFSEALRFGKALVVSDVGDMGRLGREYGVADVVPPEDPVALKEALKKKVLSDGGKLEGSREALLKLFDIETSVDRFLDDYK